MLTDKTFPSRKSVTCATYDTFETDKEVSPKNPFNEKKEQQRICLPIDDNDAQNRATE